jgi:glutathione S-transferase
MSKLTLISHQLCPYVQRAAIALAEKGVAFERIDVDLENKPDWFLALSPLGKVPLLKVGDAAIFESAVILEYLEETQGHPLHPADPLLRAQHRGWIEFGGAILADIWGFYTAGDAAALAAKTRSLGEKFARLELTLGDGPYFAGASFTLVDAAFAPVFRYFDVFDRIADFGILRDRPKIAAWRKVLGARPSVLAAVAPDFQERLWSFMLKRKSHLSELMTRQAA